MRMGGEKQCQKRELWTEEEDKILADYVKLHGKGQWNRIVKKTGLKRCGKSCRLRWINYLSPTVNRGNFTKEEEDLIARLHKLLGNRWSLIAKRVPGRTDNQVKNYWNTHLSKKLGIKKRNTDMKTRNAATSPPPIHSAGSDKLFETSTSSASSSPSHVKNTETTEQTVLGGCSHDQGAVDASESQKMSSSKGHEGSFCGFTDEFELSILSSMDFLNECVADFDWQCL